MYFSKYGKIDHVSRPDRSKSAICFIHYRSESQCKAAYAAGEEISGKSQRRHYIGEYALNVDTGENQV